MDSTDIYGGPGLDMPLTPVEFIKQPRVLLKIAVMVSTFLSAIIFGFNKSSFILQNP